jgi:hypothetical protein
MSDESKGNLIAFPKRQELARAPEGSGLALITQGRSPLEIAHGSFVIGRDPTADLFLDSPGVSRLHAMIRAMGEDVELVDLRSSNGTHLNGERVERAMLKAGDVLRIGNQEVRVAHSSGGTDEVTPSIDPPGPSGAERPADPTLQILAEERRQLAILYTIALRFLDSSNPDPIAQVFAVLDKVASFDAAFVAIKKPSGPVFRPHPAGLSLKDEDYRKILSMHTDNSARAIDGAEDSLSLSSYQARSRVLIPLGEAGWLVMLAGVSGAYSRELEFLAQLGRIVGAALAKTQTDHEIPVTRSGPKRT